ncbi:MAG TPA: hypothetical protein VKY92_28220 [Verrucomicrobiae bacterium]|nr:hypothetical protein [Verrucomicrobiae bacterium]
MEAINQPRPFAWCPLTPKGVAAFASATFGRLWLVQLIVALGTGGICAWLLSSTSFPIIAAAIERLPQEGEINNGRLTWTADSPQLLAEGRSLAIAVDLDHSAQTRSPAHVQAEFGLGDLRFYSLFGFVQWNYPHAQSFPFNYRELKPWFGAWAPILLAITVFATILWLLFSWTALSTLYCVVAWLLALYANRELTLRGGWRLSGAALMPGALVMAAALAFYGFAQLDLIRLGAAFALHFLLGWVYLVLGVLACPVIPESAVPKKNPFTTPAPPSAPSTPAEPGEISRPNPFRPSDG